MNNDDKELNEILESNKSVRSRRPTKSGARMVPDCSMESSAKEGTMQNLVQWTSSDGKRFWPASHTRDRLIPGVYEIKHCPQTGLYFEKLPVKTEGLLRFPQTNSDKVVQEIQNFWSREDKFREHGLTYKRGIMLWGPPGCHAAGTKVIMFDGVSKNVEDIEVGDNLMGPDSKPRKVFELIRGTQSMFKIIPKKGEPFIVNNDHILSLKRSGVREDFVPETINIKLCEFMKMSPSTRSRYKLYTAALDFKSQDLPLPPYFLGIWLGDGHTNDTCVTSADEPIFNYLKEISEAFGVDLNTYYAEKTAPCYKLAKSSGKSNVIRNLLKEIGVFGNKHIPYKYLRSSRDQRLELLAGLIDTDGHYAYKNLVNKNSKGYYEITQVKKQLAEDIVWLCRSLGFRSVIKNKIINGKVYYRITISGDIKDIPVKLDRKVAIEGSPNKDIRLTGFEIEEIGFDKFYGFNISGDHLYLTDDFFVHHNSGKSCTIQIIMQDVVERGGVVVKFLHPGLFIEGMRNLREIQRDTPVVVLMEDIDSILEHYSESEVLNILDGVEEVDKTVFLATTNYPEELGARIINRPSRFDKRFKIDHPNAESRKIYLEHLISKDKIREHGIDIDQWVKDTKKFSIAHLKELFVAVVILGDKYEDAIKTLRTMKEEVKPCDEYDKEPMGFGRTCDYDDCEEGYHR